MDLETISQVYDVVSSVVGTAAVIAALTPTPKDDVWMAKVYRFIDILAINIGKAKQ